MSDTRDTNTPDDESAQVPSLDPVWPTPPAESRYLWVEVLLVFSVLVLPDVYYSLEFHLVGGNLAASAGDREVGPVCRLLGTIVSRVPEILLVIFLFRFRGQSWSRMGIFRPAWGDVAVFLGVFFVDHVVSYWWISYSRVQFQAPIPGVAAAPVSGSGSSTLLLIAPQLLVAALHEEILFRSYFFSRLRTLLGNSWLSILIVTVVFTVGHLYGEWYHWIGIAMSGLIYGAAFVVTGRLLPIVLAHFVFNLGLVTQWGLGR